MLTELLGFLLLCGGCMIGVVFFSKSFESTLPLICMGIIASIYVFGLFGQLFLGAVVVFLGLSFCIALSAVRIIHRHSVHDFTTLFFTPAFFCFLVLGVIFIVLDYGRVTYFHDEYNHWMTCIKIMDSLDDFYTNPEAHSNYASYPPGVACFQYFFQKLFHLIHPNSFFSEWRMFTAYKILLVSLFMPCLTDLRHRNPLKNLTLFFLFFITPLLLYQYTYTSVLIDPILSLMYAAGFVMFLFLEKRDRFYSAYMILLCFTLVLTKDVGLYFALILVLLLFLDSHEQKLLPFFSLIAVVLAKISWQIKVTISDAKVAFGNHINLLDYTRMILWKDDTTYRQQVVNNYLDALIHSDSVLHSPLFIFILCILVMIAILLFARKFLKTTSLTSFVKRFSSVLFILIIQALIYGYSLGATYVSNFTEKEALELASFIRYIRMPLVPFVTIIAYCVFYAIKSGIIQKRVSYPLLIFLCAAFCLGNSTVRSFLNRSSVAVTIAEREPYDALGTLIQTYSGRGDTVCYVDRQNAYSQYLRFLARPATLVKLSKIDRPLEEYDLIAIRNPEEEFFKVYAGQFAEPITEESVYRFNATSGFFEKLD